MSNYNYQLAGFYNDSDIDVTLVNYGLGHSFPNQDVCKGNCFIPTGLYLIPIGIQLPDDIHQFSANHIEVCLENNQSNVIMSFCGGNFLNLYYCSGASPSDFNSFSAMKMALDGFTGKFYIVFSGSEGQYQLRASSVPPTPNGYDFDVVFKSDASPSVVNPQTGTSDVTNPMAAAFGYSYIPLSDFASTSAQPLVIGERTTQGITFQSRVRFGLYDLATTATKKAINEVVVSFTTEKDNINGPFNWPGGKMVFAKEQIFTKNEAKSYGCNTVGTAAYYLGDSNPSGFQVVNSGSYELAVTITLEDGTVFQADPEVDVEGAS